MEKLKLHPNSASYSVEFGVITTAVKLDGGRSRVRRSMVKPSHTVNIKFTLDYKKYQYLQAFLRQQSDKVFLMDLVIDGLLEEYACTLIPGSVNLEGQVGLSYQVGLKVEAEAKEYDAKADEDIIKAFEK